ncbi:hypothetical protein QYE76_047578 [Lolium multiflorum]|uniref:Transcription factor CBF/NF-Y/archaeal histone domain-containing protein n=1 Tax=Lolium multiflorum TaxID=4521 RepID=A0AAD8WZR5_LOLMU|nr:hypothetical protein QYE76_047578 [Lolium multiflorum]
MRLARPYSGVFRGGATARTGPHALPLARIKKIMKRSAGDGSGGDGTGARMISGEAPVVFSRACELFVAELTRAAWAATLDGKRRTVHRERTSRKPSGTPTSSTSSSTSSRTMLAMNTVVMVLSVLGPAKAKAERRRVTMATACFD